MWILYSLLANVSVLTAETLFRRQAFTSYVAGWPVFVPLALVSGWALYHSYSAAPKYLVAWAVFFGVNAAGRLAINRLVLHEAVSLWAYGGLVAIFAGAAAVRWK